MHNFKISVVIPCYNEQDNIEPVTNQLKLILQKYESYELIFIDDGSDDETLKAIKLVQQKNPQIKYLSLSRNFGQQNALKAGIDYSTGDCLISLDADLQHPGIN